MISFRVKHLFLLFVIQSLVSSQRFYQTRGQIRVPDYAVLDQLGLWKRDGTFGSEDYDSQPYLNFVYANKDKRRSNYMYKLRKRMAFSPLAYAG